MARWVLRGNIRGPAGPAGPPGTGSSSFTQTVPQSVWEVPHNLNRYPTAWSLFDSLGMECGEYSVQHIDTNVLRVVMDVPTAGVFRFA